MPIAARRCGRRSGGPRAPRWRSCDLGKGTGKVEGAFAELPRYFADVDRVMDLEIAHRLVHGDAAGLRPRGDPQAALLQGQPAGTELEALATYVASKSRGPEVRAAPRARQGEGGAGDGRGAVLPAPGTDGLRLRHLPRRRRQAHPPAGPAVPRQAGGGAQGGRRVAGLSRVAGHRHDHAAPHRRLLLADAPAADRLRLGRDGGADASISSTRPRAARSPRPPSSASGSSAMQQARRSSLRRAAGAAGSPGCCCGAAEDAAATRGR